MQVAVRASAAAANIIGTEQPCRVRLRLWHCSAADPTAALEVPSLTIPDAVLCSEMGVHFSACGRYLAACVACQVRVYCQLPFKVASASEHHFWEIPHLAMYTAEATNQLSGQACWLIACMVVPLSLRWLHPAALCTLCKHQLPTLKCSLLANERFTATLCVKPS